MKRFTRMLTLVCLLAASAALAGEPSPKAEVFAKIRANIEKARAATEYDKKLDAYSRALVGVEANSYRGDISCDDPEIPEINEAITALESELLEMYGTLEAAGNAPKFKPKKLETCQQVVSKKADNEKAKTAAAERRKANPPTTVQKKYFLLRDKAGGEIGRVYEDGTVYDRNLLKLGKFDPDGTVRDRMLHQLGKIDPDGTVRDVMLHQLGRIDRDGTVRDKMLHQVGKVDPDGKVKDTMNNSIGMAAGIKTEWAAAFFFFDFFK